MPSCVPGPISFSSFPVMLRRMTRCTHFWARSVLLVSAVLGALVAGCDSESSPAGGGESGGAAPVGGDGAGGPTFPGNLEPVASFTVTPASGAAPLVVSLDASDSSDPDGEIVAYDWKIGSDSAEGVYFNPTLSEVGCHEIELTVTDDDGDSDTATATVVVAAGEPAGPGDVTVDVAPIASAVLPRDLATDEGTAHFEGSVLSDGFTEVRAEVVDGKGAVRATISTPLCGAAPVLFTLDVPVPSELTAFEIRLSLIGGAEPQPIFSVADIVAGDIYVVQGQSNADSAQYSGNANENQGPFVRTFGTHTYNQDTTPNDLDWRVASGTAGTGPTIGQWPMRMAAMLAAEHETPIGVINGADPGKPIGFFQRNDENTTDPATNYGRLLTRMQNAGLTGSVRAILWYQGEAEGSNFQAHHDGFVTLMEDWAADYAGFEHLYIAQVRAGCGGNLIQLQEVQRKFADDFENVSIMSTTGLDGHDGCHYAYENGYRELGDRFAGLLGRDLYGAQPALDVAAPNPESAQFAAGGSQVVVTMRNPDSLLTVDDGSNAHFRFEGSGATLSGASLIDGKLVLSVNGDASGATGLSYLGHQQAGPWVLNENAIGLLEFYNLAIAPE
jgi:PKD repeat protein